MLPVRRATGMNFKGPSRPPAPAPAPAASSMPTETKHRAPPPKAAVHVIVPDARPVARAASAEVTVPRRRQSTVPGRPPQDSGASPLSRSGSALHCEAPIAENAAAAAGEIALSELGAAALKWKAKELGIKQKGVGWPNCCPPSGTKADIVAIRDNVGGEDAEAVEAAESDGSLAGPTEGIAVAVAHFPAEHAGDLAMSMGDRVVLIETVGPEWFRGRDVYGTCDIICWTISHVFPALYASSACDVPCVVPRLAGC